MSYDGPGVRPQREDGGTMAFVGVHAEWGRIDATFPDLGCGQDRSALHRPKAPAPVSCHECGWQVHLVHLTHRGRDVWYLRHADGAPHCASAGESMAHHLLKLELATAARAAGWSAEYEVAAPDGSWRADVLAQSPDGGRRTALEAQLSGISVAGIGMRTARYAADGMEVCWFTDRKRVPWLDTVPAVRIARPQDGGPLQVVAGAARFVPDWCADRADCRRTEPPGAGDDRPKDFRGPLPCGVTARGRRPGPSRWGGSWRRSAPGV